MDRICIILHIILSLVFYSVEFKVTQAKSLDFLAYL